MNKINLPTDGWTIQLPDGDSITGAGGSLRDITDKELLDYNIDQAIRTFFQHSYSLEDVIEVLQNHLNTASKNLHEMRKDPPF